jgi:hypothetical protein
LCVLYDAGDCPNAKPNPDCVSFTYAYSDSYVNANAYGNSDGDSYGNFYPYTNGYATNGGRH